MKSRMRMEEEAFVVASGTGELEETQIELEHVAAETYRTEETQQDLDIDLDLDMYRVISVVQQSHTSSIGVLMVVASLGIHK